MTLNVRRAVLDAVAGATPDDTPPPAPPKSGPSTTSTVAPFRAPGWSALSPTSAPAAPLEHRFLAARTRLAPQKPGSPVVADALRRELLGAFLAPRLDRSTREAKVLAALEPMLAAGRGPALVGLRTVLERAPGAGVELTHPMRDGITKALEQVKSAATDAATEGAATLSERAAVPLHAVADVAQLASLRNEGSDSQRTQAVMRVLSMPSTSALGALCAKARAVVFDDGASGAVRFTPSERQVVRQLMQEWPTATSERRAALSTANGRLFNALERALGGLAVGAPPGFADEQQARGNPLPTWLSAPATTTLQHDVELVREAQRLLVRSAGGVR